MHMVFWIYWKKGTLTKALKNLFYKNRRKDSQEIKRIREKNDLFRLIPNLFPSLLSLNWQDPEERQPRCTTWRTSSISTNLEIPNLIPNQMPNLLSLNQQDSE